ncbi:hypothetical protein N0V93_007925 [Gnomoniopsis smithogilvyi]|uniref:Tyrosinase copper-binding domain-containing protein n=1 Tax=Gnomoniopsis smithogilvyi TaxID=1191159 RepID=A0A9W8YM87_9PEZI|nr:hypothetical protein N0V93_007925 [Gnomoniopsis smithogilvyi]
MAPSYTSWAATGIILLLGSASASSSVIRRNETCTQINQRKAWTALTDTEKADYIRAEQCLMTSAPRTNITGAKTRWDELQWAHIAQSNIIHGVGSFLPWHRYYVHTHEYLLQSECNYTGAQPYWDEMTDADASTSLADASIWGSDELSFGTNGRDGDGCVVDGPFANTTLRLNQEWGVNNYTEYCLARSFSDTDWAWANSTYVDACMAKTEYATAWSCWSAYPHSSAHIAVGGTLYDQSASPGDPVFFLHHANIDRLWWEWQQVDSAARVTQMSGQSIPSMTHLLEGEWLFPSQAEIDGMGDAYNVTTLAHNLWMVDLLPNITVADIVDLSGGLSCAEYV